MAPDGCASELSFLLFIFLSVSPVTPVLLEVIVGAFQGEFSLYLDVTLLTVHHGEGALPPPPLLPSSRLAWEGLVDPHGEGRPPPRGYSIQVELKSILFFSLYLL